MEEKKGFARIVDFFKNMMEPDEDDRKIEAEADKLRAQSASNIKDIEKEFGGDSTSKKSKKGKENDLSDLQVAPNELGELSKNANSKSTKSESREIGD